MFCAHAFFRFQSYTVWAIHLRQKGAYEKLHIMQPAIILNHGAKVEIKLADYIAVFQVTSVICTRNQQNKIYLEESESNYA